jgi:hypothetical protein
MLIEATGNVLRLHLMLKLVLKNVIILSICRIGVRMKRNRPEMGVWDPGEKRAVFWEIKTFIIARYRGLRKWAVCLYPGNWW